MSNIVQRLLLFFVGIPLVGAVIIYLPHYHHAAIAAVIVAISGGCAVELSKLLEASGKRGRPIASALIGSGLPLGAYAGGMLIGLPFLEGAALGLSIAVAASAVLAFGRFALVRQDGIPAALPGASALALTIIYPGILGAFILLIASEPRFATESLIAFCAITFGNDSAAWLVGITIGRRRGLAAASPNKSAEGFAGGMVVSLAMPFACRAVFPEALRASWWQLALLGALVGATAILGDLFESALKRSARIKDSGTTVPGRGGFLDSVDSLLLSAPLFYGLSLAMGLFR
jgi:phosphatidate cytidylyltransferase